MYAVLYLKGDRCSDCILALAVQGVLLGIEEEEESRNTKKMRKSKDTFSLVEHLFG